MEGYILIHAEAGRIRQVVRELQLQGIGQADPVTGAYDVIIRVSARSLDELAQLVDKRIHSIQGVLRTLTCPVASHDALWEEHEERHQEQLEPAYAAT
jgi:DNA-binding Lrp family transcriptional regulator